VQHAAREPEDELLLDGHVRIDLGRCRHRGGQPFNAADRRCSPYGSKPGSPTSRSSVQANAAIKRSPAWRRRASGTAHCTARNACALPSTPTTTVLRASTSSSSYRRPRCRLRADRGSGARPVVARPLDSGGGGEVVTSGPAVDAAAPPTLDP
jgi:hypothetical protein